LRHNYINQQEQHMASKKESGTAMSNVLRQRAGETIQDDRPGPVIPRATIRLHTYIVHQLFFGRKEGEGRQYRDQCFASFAANLSALWACARADDPYADAKLIQIEEQIDILRDKVTHLLQSLDNLLGSLEDSGIRVETHQSVRPVDVPIAFRTVHASVAVLILGSVDRAIQKALMARHFGLVTEQDWQRVLEQSVAPMRHLFKLAQFRASGATRDDFAANNARARAALEKLGQLPADVLQGLRRPQLGPRPSKSSSLLFADSGDSASAIDDSIVAQSLMAMNPKLSVAPVVVSEQNDNGMEAAPADHPEDKPVVTRKRSAGDVRE
jgi:integrating conjugative element protein (TIGR03761 family)